MYNEKHKVKIMQENNTKPNSVDIESVSVNDVVDEQTKEKNKPENEQSPNDKIIAELNDKIAELNDKYLRAAAELENTCRRASLDVESVSRNRAMGLPKKYYP